jgi:hypothetical protein
MSQLGLVLRYNNTMAFFSKTMCAIFALSLTACFSLSLDDLIPNNTTVESKTHLLEGSWLVTTDDETMGTTYSTLEILRSGVVSHWYNQYGTDHFNEHPDAVASGTVSSTYEVYFESVFSYSEAETPEIEKKVITELNGFLAGDFLSLTGQTTHYVNGTIDKIEDISVFAERGGVWGGGGENDGANTALLEGLWLGTYTDLEGAHANMIEFDVNGDLIHWFDEYGYDLVEYVQDLVAFGSVSSENAVYFSAHYSFTDVETGFNFTNVISCNGILSSIDNNSISMDGNAQSFLNDQLYGSTEISIEATRVQTASGSSQNWRAPWR